MNVAVFTCARAHVIAPVGSFREIAATALARGDGKCISLVIEEAYVGDAHIISVRGVGAGLGLV